MKKNLTIILTIAVTALLLTIPLSKSEVTKNNSYIPDEENEKINNTGFLSNLSSPLIKLLGLIYTVSLPVAFVMLHVMLFTQFGGFLLTYGTLFCYGLIEGFLLGKPLNESLKMGLFFSLMIPASFIVMLRMSAHMLFQGEMPEDIGLPEWLEGIFRLV